VTASKQKFEEMISGEVVSFAYPYDDCAQREIEAVATISGPIKMADNFM